MNVGIVGANGFVGRALCLKFLEENKKVYAFYNVRKNKIPAGCELVASNKRSEITLDYLFVTIGSHSCTHHQFIDQLFILKQLIENISYKTVVFISSTEVYGCHDVQINEDSGFNIPKVYGLSKIANEFLIKSLESYIIIRPTYLYGDDMNKNSLLPFWINKAKKDKVITIYGDGSRKQDYLHINDFVDLCWKVTNTERTNDIIVAATGKSLSNFEVAQFICNNIKGVAIKFFGEDNSASSFYDVSHAKLSYLWEAQMKLDSWMKKFIGNEDINI